MKFGTIIQRYIFRELISPFIISLVFLIFVFLMTTLVNIADFVVNYRVGLTTVLILLVYNMPAFLKFIVPMSTMIGVLLAFLKMSSDNEIVALKAGGMSIYAMLPPVFLFCFLGCLLTAFMSIYGEPWGRLSENSLAKELNTASIGALLKERTFNSSFDDRTLYVTRIDTQQNTLEGIFIEDRSASNRVITITAPRGRLISQPEGYVYYLQLEQGQINQTEIEKQTVSNITFDTYHVRLDLSRTLRSSEGSKKEKDMHLRELREYIQARKKKDERYYLALIAFHSKFSIPFACFAMGILAVPLGIQSKFARRSFGIGLGIFFFLGYYLIMSAGEIYGRTGHYPPVIGMWAPNIVMGGIGCFLLVQCARERTIGIGGLLHMLSRKSHRGPSTEENLSPPANPKP